MISRSTRRENDRDAADPEENIVFNIFMTNQFVAPGNTRHIDRIESSNVGLVSPRRPGRHIISARQFRKRS